MMLMMGLGLACEVDTSSATTMTDHQKVVSVMKKASHFKYSHRYHTARGIEKHKCGDCWAMSAYLYNNLKRQHVHTRIIQYRTKYSSRHRSVQYKYHNRWINVPYRSYFHTNMFNNTQSHGRVLAVC